MRFKIINSQSGKYAISMEKKHLQQVDAEEVHIFVVDVLIMMIDRK